MKRLMYRMEELMEIGGTKKDIVLLAIGGVSLILSLINSRLHFLQLPFDIAWVAIILCGIPIILEAIIGLATRQRMIRLVQSADADKAKIVGLADRWATWIVIIALSAAVLTWIFTGEIIRAVTILVVFCPCALVLATPTAIMAAIGNATKHGFLVREGDALERLAKVNKITFDKTGTLTYGTPVVTEVKSVSSYSNDEIYAFSAAAEKLSEHPLGKAIVKCYGKAVTARVIFIWNPVLVYQRKLTTKSSLREIKNCWETTVWYFRWAMMSKNILLKAVPSFMWL